MGIRELLGLVRGSHPAGHDIRTPSASELLAKEENTRRTKFKETLAPGVSFVLSYEDTRRQPQEETIPAWERLEAKPAEKFYFADVPPWLVEGIRPFIEGELETATMYYHIATGTHKIVARWKTAMGNNLVGDIDHEHILGTIGVSQGIRIEGGTHPPAA